MSTGIASTSCVPMEISEAETLFNALKSCGILHGEIAMGLEYEEARKESIELKSHLGSVRNQFFCFKYTKSVKVQNVTFISLKV
uniref:Uncharacterized protein n=1 Tax=Lactuca sativa TaxID=4236 RepID=A0A9R1W5J8_LACSA|nr:hypothetical protein LSAT_V11C200099060 [Lactuca sativa]